jgi:hypothetical protein
MVLQCMRASRVLDVLVVPEGAASGPWACWEGYLRSNEQMRE